MKKAILVICMAALSCAVILLWRGWKNQVPELEDIRTLDLSQYETTYAPQDFKLKPHDRQWTLKSFTAYDADGNVTTEQIYHLDEDGQSYYIAPNGNRIDTRRLSQEKMQHLTDFVAEWDTLREEYDAAGRITFREATDQQFPDDTMLAHWYYRTDGPSGDDAISTFAITAYGSNWTSYQIDSYDRYGNVMEFMMAEDCYVKTDADGYLQMFVAQGPWPYVQRVDEYGRPLWQARYDKNGDLLGWSVWAYQAL